MLKATFAITCSIFLVTVGTAALADKAIPEKARPTPSASVAANTTTSSSKPVAMEEKKSQPAGKIRMKRAPKPLRSVDVANVPHGSVSDPRSRAYSLFYLQQKLSLTPDQVRQLDTVIQYGMDKRTWGEDINEKKILRKQKNEIRRIVGEDASKKAIDIMLERVLIGPAMPASGLSGFRRYDLGKPNSPAKDTSQSEAQDIEEEQLEAPVARIAPPEEKEGPNNTEAPTKPINQVEPAKPAK